MDPIFVCYLWVRCTKLKISMRRVSLSSALSPVYLNSSFNASAAHPYSCLLLQPVHVQVEQNWPAAKQSQYSFRHLDFLQLHRFCLHEPCNREFRFLSSRILSKAYRYMSGSSLTVCKYTGAIEHALHKCLPKKLPAAAFTLQPAVGERWLSLLFAPCASSRIFTTEPWGASKSGYP